VVPSLRPEPFGNVILEALAAGCPVLAFGGGGPDDLAQRFPKWVRVVPRSVDALADGLRDWWVTGTPGDGPFADVERELQHGFSEDAAMTAFERLLEAIA